MKRMVFWDGEWHRDRLAALCPSIHGLWMGSCVFDGARSLQGLLPDLAAHCERLIRSASRLGMDAGVTAGEVEAVLRAAPAFFGRAAELYLRPMIFAQEGFALPAGPAKFAAIADFVPVPRADRGLSVGLSSYRRPDPRSAPTDCKAACLYPLSQRALREARQHGWDNAVMLDLEGHVAELATANLFVVLDGRVCTPRPNGTFLDGITRQRIIRLLEMDGVEVAQVQIGLDDLHRVDEMFATSNYLQVASIGTFEGRDLPSSRVSARARELNRAYARALVT